MCGIFGFAFEDPMPMDKIFKILGKLEAHQYPSESRPVGGYGAGLAILETNGRIVLEKTGRVDERSPVDYLAQAVMRDEARVLIAHVRMPSPEFMNTVKFKEASQPYIVEKGNLKLVSVHNGKVENYREIRKRFDRTDVFESEKIELIDSEIIPHLFARFLNEKRGVDEALYTLFCAIQGSAAICILQSDGEQACLQLIHKGKTRGLTIWTNEQRELIFCSRKEALTKEFNDILAEGKFKERISIPYQEDVGLKLSIPIPTQKR